jgi:hypothetical protein
MAKPVPIEIRLAKYIRLGKDGCHIWTGALDKDGYGLIHKRTIEYHTAILEGLENGNLDLTETGRIRCIKGELPAKPKMGKINHWSRLPLVDLKRRLKYYQDRREAEVKPLLTAIDLLKLAEGESVQIDTADYQNLLSGTSRY